MSHDHNTGTLHRLLGTAVEMVVKKLALKLAHLKNPDLHTMDVT